MNINLRLMIITYTTFVLQIAHYQTIIKVLLPPTQHDQEDQNEKLQQTSNQESSTLTQ